MSKPLDPATLPAQVKSLVAAVIDVDEEEIPDEGDLIETLDVDSVMRLEILVVLERTFSIKFGQEDLLRITTLNDVCNLLLEKSQEQAS